MLFSVATVSTAQSTNISFFSSLTPSDWIQLTGIIISTITSIVTFVISTFALWQNSKMIEDSSRPVISVYTQRIIYNNKASLYLVIKNFGHSTAYMTKFWTDTDFSKSYGFNAPRNYLEDLNHCIIAPGQSRICYLDYTSIPESVRFSLSYHSNSKKGKIYSEDFTIDLKAAVSMPTEGPASNTASDSRIASVLENMLFKDL